MLNIHKENKNLAYASVTDRYDSSFVYVRISFRREAAVRYRVRWKDGLSCCQQTLSDEREKEEAGCFSAHEEAERDAVQKDNRE